MKASMVLPASRFRAVGGILFSLLVLVGLQGLGCRTPGGISVNRISSAGIKVHSKWFGNRIEIESVSMDDGRSGGLARVQISAGNLKREPFSLEYRFRWFDEKGIQVGQLGEIWQRAYVGPRETVTMVGVAPDPRARDYEFYVKLLETSNPNERL